MLNERVRARLGLFGRISLDNAADGNCFWHVLSGHTGIPVLKLRQGTAKRMRENPAQYNGFGDFDRYGGYEAYCDLVETGPIFLVQGNAEVYSLFICNILILIENSYHFLLFFPVPSAALDYC